MSRPASGPPIRLLIDNRKARYEFHLNDSFEAGLALTGPEVKSLRMGNANLAEAWIRLDGKGAALVGCYIAPYAEAQRDNPEDPRRPRRLLLHIHELAKLKRGVRQKGMTVVPVKVYLKGSRIKLELALAKGKAQRDKRETVKARDAARDMRRPPR